MDGADILGILALAVAGGAGAYVAWYVSQHGTGVFARGRSTPARYADRADGPGQSGELPLAHDPTLAAEIASLRAEVAAIASTQTRVLHDQADRAGMLLAEIRAVTSVMDPKVIESLARIESTLGSAPDGAGPGSDDGPGQPREGDRLYVVPGAREDSPTGADGESSKTIRRG